jgi:hypothetical protein
MEFEFGRLKISIGLVDKRPIRDFVLTEYEAQVLRAMDPFGSSYVLLRRDTELDDLSVSQGIVGLKEKGLVINNGGNMFDRYRLTEEGTLARAGFTPLHKQTMKGLVINPSPRVRLTIQESEDT